MDNKRLKSTAAKMRNDLLRRVRQGEASFSNTESLEAQAFECFFRLIAAKHLDALGHNIGQRELHSRFPNIFWDPANQSGEFLPENLEAAYGEILSSITAKDWQNGLTLGWLFQYFFSERRSEICSREVAAEDLPIATQVFTPSWVGKVLLQNSVARLYPGAGELEYFMPGEEESCNRNLEDITIMDPACGAGHLLLEAYDLLRSLYMGSGYNPKQAAGTILEKNLFGLDLDERAVRCARFLLLVKAAADDPNIIEKDNQFDIKIYPIQSSQTLNLETLTELIPQQEAEALINLFNQADMLGTLIRIPEALKGELDKLIGVCREANLKGDSNQREKISGLLSLLNPALLLSTAYDVVVTNPPYLGERYLGSDLRHFGREYFPDSRVDLFSMFLERVSEMVDQRGYLAAVTMESWMFTRRFERFREKLLRHFQLRTLVHMDKGIMGIAFGTAAFVLGKNKTRELKGCFARIEKSDLNRLKVPDTFPPRNSRSRQTKDGFFYAKQSKFKNIPGAPLAYWLNAATCHAFKTGTSLGSFADIKQGLATGDNKRFLRYWFEIPKEKIGFGIKGAKEAAESEKKWFPYNKGGQYRKWYGNSQYVVNWHQDGREIKDFRNPSGGRRSRPQNTSYYFKAGITWTFLSASRFGVRKADPGCVFDVAGSMIFCEEEDRNILTAFLVSRTAFEFLKILNPTVNFQVGNLANLPLLIDKLRDRKIELDLLVDECVEISRSDWNESERSWNFVKPLSLDSQVIGESLDQALTNAAGIREKRIRRLEKLEAKNNNIIEEIYGLTALFEADPLHDRITLFTNDRSEEVRSLLSYFIGCLFGRFTLLHENGREFLSEPLTSLSLSCRSPVINYLREFLSIIWGENQIDKNLELIAKILSSTETKSVEDVILEYFRDDFYQDHLKLYNKHPIYWLISSGERNAFMALVYYHALGQESLTDLFSLTEERKANRNLTSRDLEELQGLSDCLGELITKQFRLDPDLGVHPNYQLLQKQFHMP